MRMSRALKKPRMTRYAKRTSKLALLAALTSTALLAVGCSKSPMAGYESEKSRLRGALPASVQCKETPHPSASLLQCAEKNFNLVLTGAKAQDGSDIVNVQMSFLSYFNAGYSRDSAEKILAVYDVTGPHANGCLLGATAGVYSKPADPFVLVCQREDRNLRISVRQQRKV